MVDVGLVDDGVGVRGDEQPLQVVDDHLVHTLNAREKFVLETFSFKYLPWGPRAERVILARPCTASMFLIMASSRPV